MWGLSVIYLVILASQLQVLQSFVPHASLSIKRCATFVGPRHRKQSEQQQSRITLASSKDGIMDVPFETVEEEEPTPKKKKKRRYDDDDDYSLLDVAMEQDPYWKDKRVPFVAKDGQSSIDCKLALCLELDGFIYGLGVPFDHPVICTIQPPEHEADTTPVKFVDPDDPENEELLNIMATALHKYVGEDLKLRKTPQVLTIEGDLDKYVDGWEDKLYAPDEEYTKNLMADTNMTSKDLFQFFREHFGEEEYNEILNSSFEDAEMPEELVNLFNVPGFGTERDDIEGVERLREEARSKHPMDSVKEVFPDISKEDGAAIKLCGFKFRDGNFYSLAKPLQPHTLVGRKTTDEEFFFFELLSDEDQEIIVPKLQEKCFMDIQSSGYQLRRTSDMKP